MWQEAHASFLFGDMFLSKFMSLPFLDRSCFDYVDLLQDPRYFGIQIGRENPGWVGIVDGLARAGVILIARPLAPQVRFDIRIQPWGLGPHIARRVGYAEYEDGHLHQH